MKRILILLTILWTTFQIASMAQEQNNDTISPLENFHKVDEGVYRSGQPNTSSFQWLEENNFKEVLNLRRYHSDNDEAKYTNLKLHRIKVRASRVKEKHLLQAMRIIRDRKGNILIHCHHGSDRTGAVIATYRIIYQGWTKEDAIKEMKEGNYGFHGIYRNLPKLIQNLDIEKFKEELNKDLQDSTL